MIKRRKLGKKCQRQQERNVFFRNAVLCRFKTTYLCLRHTGINMEFLLIGCFVLSLALIFAVPARTKHLVSGIPLLVLLVISSWVAVPAIFSASQQQYMFHIPLAGLKPVVFFIDALSGFFILTVNFSALTAYLFAGTYLDGHLNRYRPAWISVHYLSLLLLYASMLLVCTQRSAFSFLLSWELMTLSSFLLVIFDNTSRANLKTGINYLVQMHLSMFLLLMAFLVAGGQGSYGFASLPAFFGTHRELPLFLLFFAGFGIKAGFIPFHTWLPDAHPSAPSHVSALMSGVMIKMGIYGIFRVISTVQHDFLTIGIFILVISLLTGIYGVLQAIVQHDLKKLLAYHSIENIGIIGTGIGLGCIGLAMHHSELALLGFGGGLLHVLNHSLFKSLLFFAAGNVYNATGTRFMDLMGGLAKKMPFTAFFFLLGALSICGLPPFNGFISEYLLYLGMIGSIHQAGFYGSIGLIMAILGLTLTGGLAVFCFTKAFGIAFLGEARSDACTRAVEPRPASFTGHMLIAAMIIAIGFAPALFVKPVLSALASVFIPGTPAMTRPVLQNLGMISLSGGIFVLLVVGLFLLRRLISAHRQKSVAPTWGCGYQSPSARMQYTATSYAENVAGLSSPIINLNKEMKPTGTEEIFPKPGTFVSHPSEKLEEWLVNRPFLALRRLLRRIAFLQTGQIRHYILYPFVFLLLIFLLTLLNLL